MSAPDDPRFAPVTLAGAHVRLEPLVEADLDALCAVGLDPELWRHGLAPLTTREAMQAWLASALAEAEAGRALPFATRLAADGRLVGSSRFGEIALAHRRVEIGWTWIARPWQRSAVNTEAKLLMLRHAFGPLGCRRVELKTDAKNAASRAAITRIGAREEGILRKHMVRADGSARDSVYYSILDEKWPAVEARLVGLLARGAGPSEPPWS